MEMLEHDQGSTAPKNPVVQLRYIVWYESIIILIIILS